MSNLQAKLYQDLKQRQLNKPKHNTGISRLIEKSRDYSHSKLEKEFKKRLEKGLFRIPDIGKGEHLIIDAKEKEEEDEEEEEEEYDDLTPSLREEHKKLKEGNIRRKKAIEDVREYREKLREEAEDKSEDLNEDTDIELEEDKLERKEKMMRDIEEHGDLFVEHHKKELIQRLYGGDEIFVHDSKPMTFNDYLNIAREREGEIIGVIKPYSNNLQFYLYNNGEKIKLYKGQAKRFTHEQVDEVRLQLYKVKIDEDDLPEDVVVINPDDDDDDYPKGNRLLTESKVLKKMNEEIEEEIMQEIEEENHEDHKKLRLNRDDDNLLLLLLSLLIIVRLQMIIRLKLVIRIKRYKNQRMK